MQSKQVHRAAMTATISMGMDAMLIVLLEIIIVALRQVLTKTLLLIYAHQLAQLVSLQIQQALHVSHAFTLA